MVPRNCGIRVDLSKPAYTEADVFAAGACMPWQSCMSEQHGLGLLDHVASATVREADALPNAVSLRTLHFAISGSAPFVGKDMA